jgi:thymidylate synthase
MALAGSGIVSTPGGLSPDDQYMRLVRTVLDLGDVQEGRNGKVRVCIGGALSFSLRDGEVPFLTKKRLAWKTCLRELLWFIEGNTSAKELSARGCKIWDANASREALDARGLTEYPEGELGPVYGHQWRRWGADCDDAEGPGTDQLAEAIVALRDPDTRSSRRIVVSAWNVGDLSKMALPPCHMLFQFHVTRGDELTCTMYQRSADVGLGLPFNMASYGMLTHFVARASGLRAVRLVMMLGNVHIYENHVEQLTCQFSRRPSMSIPRLELERIPTEIDAVREEHVRVLGYEHAGDLPMPMST